MCSGAYMWLSWTRKSNTDLVHPLPSRKIIEMIFDSVDVFGRVVMAMRNR